MFFAPTRFQTANLAFRPNRFDSAVLLVDILWLTDKFDRRVELELDHVSALVSALRLVEYSK